MSIVRISEFQSREEVVDALREFLVSILPLIKSSEGCQSAQLCQDRDHPTKFIVIETWDSIEAHQASVKNIPQEKLGEVMPLLDASPSGSYFNLLSQK